MGSEKQRTKSSARLPGVISPARAATGYVGVLRSQRRALLRRSERPVGRVSDLGQGQGSSTKVSTVCSFDENASFYLGNKEFAEEVRAAGYFGIRPIFSAGD